MGFSQEFVQGKVHHIAMVEFLRCNILADRQPETMQKVDLLGSEVRRVRPQVKDVFLPVWRVDFERQLRLRLGQRFPGQTRDARLFRNGSPWRESQNNRGRPQALCGAENAVPFFCCRSHSKMDRLSALFRQVYRARKKLLLFMAENLFTPRL